LTVSGMAASTANNFILWMATSSTFTAAALTDWYIMCTWSVTSKASPATQVTASITVTPVCNYYAAATASTWNTTATPLNTSSSSVVDTGKMVTTVDFSFDFMNATTSNFTLA